MRRRDQGGFMRTILPANAAHTHHPSNARRARPRHRLLQWLLLSTALSASTLVSAPAAAQFVCGGSANGAEPQAGAGAVAGGNAVACGPNAQATGAQSVAVGNNAQGTGSNATAIGQNA